jgi:hypothetical protein
MVAGAGAARSTKADGTARPAPSGRMHEAIGSFPGPHGASKHRAEFKPQRGQQRFQEQLRSRGGDASDGVSLDELPLGIQLRAQRLCRTFAVTLSELEATNPDEPVTVIELTRHPAVGEAKKEVLHRPACRGDL